MAKSFCNPSDLAIATLLQFHLQKGVAGSRSQRTHLGRTGDAAIQIQALSPAIKGCRIGLASHPDAVGLAVVVAGVGEFQGQLPLVATIC